MAKVSADEVKANAKSFLGSLFDFSFSAFITTKLITFLYGAGIILGAIFGVVTILGAFKTGGVMAGLISVVVTPVAYFLGIVILRIWLEIVIVLFKIEENTK